MIETVENADVQQVSSENALVIAVSHSAVFGAEGEVQEAGVAFPLVQAIQRVNERLLQLDSSGSESLQFEVVLICTNGAQRDQVQTRTRDHGLQIHRFSFSGEDDFIDSLLKNRVHLFLTTDSNAASQAANKGVFSALLDPLSACGPSEQLRVMFCGDAMLDPSSEVKTGSHQASQVFWSHLGKIRQKFGAVDSPLSLVLLSSQRDINSCCRALQSLRTLGVNVDEAYCLGGSPRKPMMSLLRPHFLLGAPEE
ncbi:cytosolic 5'-nucleotidase 1A-like [Periophthalmus magnuspinnatus]|uniref:cytosolic 5'-nucleotidase 1A-like n=1 Tax=Periophthalmus magnuspinnatus TaxID=409849 RepID=UPI00145B088D|nr:cytosolic 5'-nucleotidase 1A-like [Periophthalmus magnuspinnatus]